MQLVDTGTPGVTVARTGAASSVTNLGAIAAEAGGVGATVTAGTIGDQLSAGINVTLTTGAGNPQTDPDRGNIVVNAPIRTSGSSAAALTRNASKNMAAR